MTRLLTHRLLLFLAFAVAAPPGLSSAAGQSEMGRTEDGPVQDEELWDQQRAAAEMERLRAENGLLKGLLEAQGVLEAWNVERAGDGVSRLRLPGGLCLRAALAPWCDGLPGTFESAPDDATASVPEKRGDE